MSKSKRDYIPRKFESDSRFLINRKKDTSSNIYMSMLLSPSWQSLTKNQQILYIYCKAQYFGKNYINKKDLMTDNEEINSVDFSLRFVFNRSMWQKLYKLYPSDNGKFYKDMDKLIENGFINKISSGKCTRTKTIYELSDRWRNK